MGARVCCVRGARALKNVLSSGTEGGRIMERNPSSWLDVILAVLAFVISMTIAFELLPPETTPDLAGRLDQREQPRWVILSGSGALHARVPEGRRQDAR